MFLVTGWDTPRFRNGGEEKPDEFSCASMMDLFTCVCISAYTSMYM